VKSAIGYEPHPYDDLEDDTEPDRAALRKTEITSEMIDAGEEILLGDVGAAINYNWNPRDLAFRVYQAMAQRGVGSPR
jgi:hypothetical protein